jgi:hypothetical protein
VDKCINTFILFMDETSMIGLFFMTIFDSLKSDILKQNIPLIINMDKFENFHCLNI